MTNPPSKPWIENLFGYKVFCGTNSEEQAHEEARKQGNTLLLAYQITTKSGKLTFNYTSDKNVQTFLKHTKDLRPEELHFFEQIVGNTYMCFDLDLHYNELTTKIYEGLSMNNIAKKVYSFFESFFIQTLQELGIYFNPEKIRIIDSSNDKKVSLHILYKVVLHSLIYENKFVAQTLNQIINKHNKDLQEDEQIDIGLDLTIYSNKRNMRIIGNSKAGENRPLKRASWHRYSETASYEDFFYTNIPKDNMNVIIFKKEVEEPTNHFELPMLPYTDNEKILKMAHEVIMKYNFVPQLCNDNEMKNNGLTYGNFLKFAFSALNLPNFETNFFNYVWTSYRHRDIKDPEIMFKSISRRTPKIPFNYIVRIASKHPDFENEIRMVKKNVDWSKFF